MRLRFAVGKADETGKCPHLNSSDREKLFPAGEGIRAGGLEAILRFVKLVVKLVRDVQGSKERRPSAVPAPQRRVGDVLPRI